MSRLYPSLPLYQRESAESYVSRLACLHQSCARFFCVDFGTTIQAVITGDDSALAKIEGLAGLSSGALSQWAIRRGQRTMYEIRHEKLSRASLRRERVFVCPRCLQDDVSSSPQLSYLSAHGRTIWMLASIRTCHIHGVALEEIGSCSSSKRGDIASVIQSALPDLARLSERATTRNASNLERYLIERIEKGAVDTWLDRLELHAVAKLCETIGAVARHGRDVVASELSPSQWWEAGGAGFDIASQGEPGMFSFLSGLQQSYPRASGANEGPKATFGYFYEWLQGVEDPAYDEIKDLVARHAMATTPVGPGDFVFGRPIVRRIWHSVRTASLEYDAHPKRLRKLLALGGVIPEDHRGQTDNAVLFDAERHRETLERISTSMSLREVETYLGAGRVHAQLLYDHGFIKPFVSGEVEGISAHAFAREDLDDFMCRLEAGATQIDRCAPPIYPIADAARRANRSAAEIVAAIVDDKLQWKGKLRGAVGFASIVVDLNEIKELLKDPTPDAQALYLVARRLGTSQHVVRAAIENGILSSTVVKNPRNRCPTKAIPNSEVERFQKQFISLFEIARAYGVHHLNMRKTLSEKGIHPAFDRAKLGATFFRRSEIDSAF